MNCNNLPRMWPGWFATRGAAYLFVFVATGLVAVVVKAYADLSHAQAAGVISMLPVKMIAAWLIVGARLGSQGVRDSTSGMVVGLLAITLMVFTVRGLATSFRPPVLVLLGLAAWTAVAVGLMHLTR